MDIKAIAGFATITEDPDASGQLFEQALGLPLVAMDDYRYMDHFPGTHHFGVWPLKMAAQSCFGQDEWPSSLPKPTSTIEFELADVEAVHAAVASLRADGQAFVHEARTEPWGQTVARFLSPEGVLIGLSFAPWLHETPHA